MKYFELYELVDRNTFQKWGENAWNLLHPDALDALDGIREFFGVPVIVNNWYGGGQLQFRGYRPADCMIGTLNSYHKRGMAFDSNIKGFDSEDARQIIIENRDNPLLIKIQRMENYVDWIHFDIGSLTKEQNRIYLFKA
jgi:hypothetical protein